jgi:hypothetical protein
MISAFHLFWIIPLSCTFGFGIATLLAVLPDYKEWNENNKD